MCIQMMILLDNRGINLARKNRTLTMKTNRQNLRQPSVKPADYFDPKALTPTQLQLCKYSYLQQKKTDLLCRYHRNKRRTSL